MAAPIRFLSGRNQQQKIGIEGSTENQKVLEVVGRVGIGTTIFEPNKSLDVRGDVDVDGHTELDNVNVSGVSTFTGAIDANGDLDVDGHTELDNVNVSGVSTFVGLGTFKNDLYVSDNVYISGFLTATRLYSSVFGEFTGSSVSADNLVGSALSVSGLSTFTGAAEFKSSIDVDGHTELDNVNVSGATTTGGLLDINAGAQANTLKVEDLTDNRVVIVGTGGELEDDANLTFNGTQLAIGVNLDVDGHTELDNVNVSGAITATTFTGNLAGTVNTAAQPNITSVGTLGALTVSGDITANGNIVGDSSTNITGIAGVTATTLSGTLQTAAQTNVTSVGTLSALTVSGDITANGNIAGDNSTNITGIAGVTATTLSGTLQTAAQTNVTSVGTLSALTVSGDITANGNIVGDSSTNITGIASVTATTLSGTLQTAAQTNITSVGTLSALTVSGDITANGNIAGDNSTNITGIAGVTATTLSGTLQTAAQTNITSVGTLIGLDVNGHSELDDVNVSGALTATSLNVTNKLITTGIGISIANGAGNTAYIEGPSEIWIDPHPFGVGQTSGSVRIRGDLYVDGTEFIVDVDKIELGDFNIGIASTVSTNSLLDGAGLGIGATSIRKTITWNNATSALMSSENWNLASGKHYEINGTDVLTSTTLGSGVVNSSLTSVGTLSALTVSGDITANGNIAGDNSTNITGIAGVTATTLSGTLQTAAQTNITSVGTLSALTVSGDITANGNIAGDNSTNITGIAGVTATTLSGTLQTAAQTNVTSVGTLSALTVSGDITANGNITGDNATNISGINSVTATSFYGSGVNLTALNASNLGSGTVPDARFPAILPAISGANLTGITASQIGALTGVDIGEEGSVVGNVGSINFVSSNLTATASGAGATITLTNTPTFSSLNVTGITTIPNISGVTTFANTVNVGTGITLDSTSGIISATAFYGDGQNLSNLINQRIEGLQVFDEGVAVGTGFTFAAIDVVGNNVSVSAVGLGTTARITVSDTPTFDTVTVTNNITANGNIVGDNSTNISGINSVTATLFHGSGANLTSIPNSALTNDSVSFGGVSLDLGQTDATPAFNLSDATDYPTSSLTGTITNAQLAGSIADGKLASTFLKNVVEDTTPQLGGNLDFNSKFITGTGGINVSGVVTATTFVGNVTGTTSNASGATGDFSIVDKIVHTGDTDTAVRFPAANTFSVETAGSERLRVLNNGVVAIGTDESTTINSSAAQTQILGTVSDRALSLMYTQANASGPQLNFAKGRDGDNSASTAVSSGDLLGSLHFAGADGSDFNSVGAEIVVKVDGTPGSNDMPGRIEFKTTADGASSPTERLRIDSAGRMSLGGTPPTGYGAGRVSLDIHSSGATVSHLALTNSTTGTDGSSNGFNIIQNGLNTLLFLRESGFMSFSTAGTEAVRINSDGKLLLGSTSLVENNNYGPNISFQVSSDVTGVINATSYNNSFKGAIEIMRAKGTAASPTDVVDTTELGNVNFYGYNSNGASGDKFQLAASLSAIVDGTPGSGSQNMPGALIFRTATASTGQPLERARVSSAGNVGINSTVPSEKLDVLGNVKATSFIGALSGNATSATTATNVTVADESSDTTCFPLFATAATGDLAPKSGSNLTFNSSTGTLTASALSGTLQTAAQTNITSVGTLSALTVSGDITANGNIVGDNSTNISGISALNAAGTVTFGADADDVQFFGTTKILRMGGSSGFQIQEEGSSASITQGTGPLRFYYDSGNQYKWAVFNNAGSVELYHANNKKFETTSSGVSVTGTVAATTFSGALSGNADTATTATNVTVADESSDTTCFPLFVTAATGNLAPKSGSNLTFNSSTGTLTASALSSLDTLTVAGITNLNNDTFFNGVNYNVTWDKSADTFNFQDNAKATFGTGNDLEIYHDSSNSYIKEGGVGVLKISSNRVEIQSGSGEDCAKFQGDAAVELYYDNSKKFETTVSGITVTGGVNATGVITATSLDAAISEWVLGANGSSDYTFTGPGLTGAENDPSIYLVRGQKYNFKNSSGGHPFRIQSTPNGSTGTQYNDGITNNDAGNGVTLNWNVQFDAPDVLYYQCTSHAAMGGKIYIGNSGESIVVGAAVTINSSGINATGVVTATSFAGDGSSLTNIVSPSSNGEFYTGITSSRQIAPLSFETTVFTFPSTAGKQYVIESINVANVDESVGLGTTVNIIASIQDATAGEQTYIAYNVPIVTGGLIELLKNPIVAGPSDVIRMWSTNDGYAGVSNATDVYVNYTEFTSTDYISKFASTASITSTDTTTLYTSTSNPTAIEKIGFANRTDTGDFPISIKITNGTTTSYLAKDLIIPRYSTVDILDRPKRIETGAKIEVEVGSTSTVDVIISGKKITS